MTEIFIDAHEVHELAAEMKHHADTVPGLTRRAVSKVGHDMQALAMAKCRVDTGNLRSSISLDVTSLGFDLGPTAEYGAAIELGVPHPYVITAKDGGFLRFMIDGHEVFARSVTHPPSPPQPYLGPAFDAGLPILEEALGSIGGQAISR